MQKNVRSMRHAARCTPTCRPRPPRRRRRRAASRVVPAFASCMKLTTSCDSAASKLPSAHGSDSAGALRTSAPGTRGHGTPRRTAPTDPRRRPRLRRSRAASSSVRAPGPQPTSTDARRALDPGEVGEARAQAAASSGPCSAVGRHPRRRRSSWVFTFVSSAESSSTTAASSSASASRILSRPLSSARSSAGSARLPVGTGQRARRRRLRRRRRRPRA